MQFAVDLPLNMPAATKNITLQEDKPSLRVTSELPRGGRLASARRICWFWSPNSMENSMFDEISSSGTCHGCTHANLGPVQTFSISYGLSWGFAWAKRFCCFEGPRPSRKRYFHENSSPDTYHGCTIQTLESLELFLYPMDWAETLHAQNYDLNGSRKNTPGQNGQVNPWKIFDFPSEKYT